MRVLHILPTREAEYGGPVVVAEELVRELQVQDIEASIYPPDTESALRPGLWKKFFGIKTIVSNYDLIHIHGLWSFSSTVAVYMAKKIGVPYIITPHGMLDEWALSRGRWKKFIFSVFFEKNNLIGASGVHFLNNEELEEAKNFGVDFTPFILPNGIRKTQFDNLPLHSELEKKYPHFKGKILALFLGRLHPKKGINILLKALAKTVESVPNIHLVIAGPNENGYRKTLERVVDKYNLSKHVSFVGMIKGRVKLEMLSLADFFVLSSYQEGDSIAIKEAMASNLPVIITPACHFPDVMKLNAGLVVQPDIYELSQALEVFSLNTKGRILMGNNAHKIINQQYIWPIIVERLLCIYKDIFEKDKTSIDWKI